MLRFVNLHYAPDVASTGQHLTDLAEFLAARGARVEVVTARGLYAGGVLDAPAQETRAGVRVRRLRTPGLGRRSRVARVIDYAVFYAQVLWIACGERAVDGTVYLTTPPLLGVVGWLAKRLRGRPYGIWSMDLHPDAELAAGMLNPRGIVARVLSWLNDRGYRAADFVVDLGPYMRRRIVAKGVDPDRMHTVSVWGPAVQSIPALEAHPAAPQASRLRTQLGLGPQCVVMYSGNAGIVHEFAPVLEAMRRLNEDAGVYFLFVGGGPRRSEIEAFARTHALRNFSYQPYVPLADLADALATGDIHLITLRAPFAGISVPGKLYGIMGAARPALFVGPLQCETADAIGEAACGVVVDATDAAAADQVVSAIRAWRDDPAAARVAGARGYAAYAARFQQDPNCRAFARVLAAEWPATCGATSEGRTDSDAETNADAYPDRLAAAMPPAQRGAAGPAASGT